MDYCGFQQLVSLTVLQNSFSYSYCLGDAFIWHKALIFSFTNNFSISEPIRTCYWHHKQNDPVSHDTAPLSYCQQCMSFCARNRPNKLFSSLSRGKENARKLTLSGDCFISLLTWMYYIWIWFYSGESPWLLHPPPDGRKPADFDTIFPEIVLIYFSLLSASH